MDASCGSNNDGYYVEFTIDPSVDPWVINNNIPLVRINAIKIPTLHEWSMLVFALLLGMIGAYVIMVRSRVEIRRAQH